MPFTVTYDGGMDVAGFEAYARVMHAWNIDVANTWRTPEPGTRARWLPVWDDQAQAERFAQELRSVNKHAWRVYRVDKASVSEGALGPVDIFIGRRSDGC